MTAAAPAARTGRGGGGPASRARALLGGDSWSLALWGLLVALLVITKLVNPRYDLTDLRYLTIAVLPIAFAAVGQAIVVIAGGIDLSLGGQMALINVTTAVLMAQAGEAGSIGVVLLMLAMGLVIGLLNGLLVVYSRVPDIVVTLAMSYVWAGAALLVLSTPGGAAASWFKGLGDLSFLLLVGIVGLVWIPLRRSRLGLSLYAVGSNRLAAFRSGVNVERTRIAAYTLTGLFAALGGLALTMNTGIGTPIPGPYTLNAVAAIVLGGVSLAGGRGGVVGPIVAVFVLSLIRTNLLTLRVDPNLVVVIQGAIMVIVVMIGAFVALRRKQA